MSLVLLGLGGAAAYIATPPVMTPVMQVIDKTPLASLTPSASAKTAAAYALLGAACWFGANHVRSNLLHELLKGAAYGAGAGAALSAYNHFKQA